MKLIKKSFFNSLLLMIFAFFNQINTMNNAKANETEKAKSDMVQESQEISRLLEQIIENMNPAELAMWKKQLKDVVSRMNKDVGVIVKKPKEITMKMTPPPSDIPAPPIIKNTGIVPPPSDIPEPPKIVGHEGEFDDFTHFINMLKNIKSFVKKAPDKKNIGLFNFTEWFKEIDSIEQEMKSVRLTSPQTTELQTLIKDIKPLIVNSCAQWIIADLNLEFSGPQAQFYLYFTMIQDWENDPNIDHAKKMIASGSKFDTNKAQIKQRITTLSFEINNYLELIIKNATLLTAENRDLLFTKILEYIYGTFKTDTLPGKANTDRSLFAIVQTAIKYINYAFTANPTPEEKQAVADFDDTIISPCMLTLFVTTQTLQKSTVFDKNKVTSIYNAIKNLISPEREKIEKKFGYHEEW